MPEMCIQCKVNLAHITKMFDQPTIEGDSGKLKMSLYKWKYEHYDNSGMHVLLPYPY